MSFAAAQYRAATVGTASPVQIVVRLYDAALRFLAQARVAEEQGKRAERSAKLQRCHAIVSELQVSLVHSHAPELCADLERLYEFVLHTLTQASVTGESDGLESAEKVLRELREAWSELARRNG